MIHLMGLCRVWSMKLCATSPSSDNVIYRSVAPQCSSLHTFPCTAALGGDQVHHLVVISQRLFSTVSGHMICLRLLIRSVNISHLRGFNVAYSEFSAQITASICVRCFLKVFENKTTLSWHARLISAVINLELYPTHSKEWRRCWHD